MWSYRISTTNEWHFNVMIACSVASFLSDAQSSPKKRAPVGCKTERSTDHVIIDDDVVREEEDTKENYGLAKIESEIESCKDNSRRKPELSYIALIGEFLLLSYKVRVTSLTLVS